MRKLLLLLLVSSMVSLLHAQDSTTYKKNLDLLLSDAQTNFLKNKGGLIQMDTAKQIQFYKTNIDLKCTKSFIQRNMDDNSMVALYYFDIADWEALKNSMPLTTVAIDKINQMHQSGKYRGRDIDNGDGSTTTELKDADGNYIMEFTSSNKDKYVKLYVYSKSWGKR